MHEATVAQSLMEVILHEARKRHARPVRAKVSCGELNKINDEVLSFAFEAIAKDTLCEGMTLQIEHKPLQARCKTCGGVFAVDISNTQCPDCRGSDFELLPDAPLVLDEIEFESTENGQGERRQEDSERQ
ncbi:MAG: hydrogenase maturation nickel metallochaperone HypA [Phycisphaerales bacterium]